MVNICKLVNTNLQHCPHTSGSFTASVSSIGHRVKLHQVTPGVGNERGDIEVANYVVLPRGQDNCHSPGPLIQDVTMTHDRYGRSTSLHTNGKITHTLSSNGNSQSDDALKNMGCENQSLQTPIRGSVWSDRIRACCSELNFGSLIRWPFALVFSCMPIVRLVLWPENCSEESDQFRFLRVASLTNRYLKDSVGLTLTKVSVMRVFISLDYLHGSGYLFLISFALVVRPLFFLLP